MKRLRMEATASRWNSGDHAAGTRRVMSSGRNGRSSPSESGPDAIGAAGYVMRTRSMPLAPAIIGMILGPMAEQQLRRALAIAEGSATVFVTRPISLALLLAAAALLVGPMVVGSRQPAADS